MYVWLLYNSRSGSDVAQMEEIIRNQIWEREKTDENLNFGLLLENCLFGQKNHQRKSRFSGDVLAVRPIAVGVGSVDTLFHSAFEV